MRQPELSKDLKVGEIPTLLTYPGLSRSVTAACLEVGCTMHIVDRIEREMLAVKGRLSADNRQSNQKDVDTNTYERARPHPEPPHPSY